MRGKVSGISGVIRKHLTSLQHVLSLRSEQSPVSLRDALGRQRMVRGARTSGDRGSAGGLPAAPAVQGGEQPSVAQRCSCPR